MLKTKKMIGFALVLASTACGGGDKSNFDGASWNIQVTDTVTCLGSSSSSNASIVITFASGDGADVEYTSNDGCLFEYSLSGDTASLSNGPVSCSGTASDSTVVQFTYDTYTLTSSNGHNLELNISGSDVADGVTCTFTEVGSGTR